LRGSVEGRELTDRAERVEALWEDLLHRATKLRHSLPKERRDAFYEYVYTPVALVTQMNRMFIAGAYLGGEDTG
jgi:hypothetical protein